MNYEIQHFNLNKQIMIKFLPSYFRTNCTKFTSFADVPPPAVPTVICAPLRLPSVGPPPVCMRTSTRCDCETYVPMDRGSCSQETRSFIKPLSRIVTNLKNQENNYLIITRTRIILRMSMSAN